MQKIRVITYKIQGEALVFDTSKEMEAIISSSASSIRKELATLNHEDYETVTIAK